MSYSYHNEPHHKKICLRVFRPGPTNWAVQPQKMARGLKFRKKLDYTINVAETKVLISCLFSAQLIFIFIFAQAKNRFSHEAAQIKTNEISCMEMLSNFQKMQPNGNFGKQCRP